MIRELLKLEGAEGGLLNASLEVTDDAGEIVLEFPFTEVILNVFQAKSRHQALTPRWLALAEPPADDSDCLPAWKY